METLTKFIFLFLVFPVIALARPVRGTYEVPAPEEFKPYASFAVRFKSEEYDSGQRALTFPLPKELTGQQLSLAMAESGTPGRWTGDNVEADCQKIGRYFECRMSFSNLAINTEAVVEVLKQKYPLEADLARALELAERFKAEPAGILRYRLRGGDRE
jgi:hypothetical protein